MTKEKDDIIREMKKLKQKKQSLIFQIKEKKKEIKVIEKTMNGLITELTNKVD